MNVAAHSIRDTRTSRVGMAMMLLGAFLAIGGLVQTTTSHFADQSCPSGTTLIAKFTYDHGYSFDSPSGNSHVVTLSHTSASGADWSSTQAVSNVIVKGGPSAVMTSLAPPQTSGHFSNAGLPDVGHSKPDISSVQFCGLNVPPTSSTTQPVTSTTANCHCTTTTTSPSTSTTSNCGCTTTTTLPPTTTTHCTCSTTTTSTTTTPTTQPQETTTSKATTTTSTSTTTTSTTTPVTEPTTTTSSTTSTTSTTLPETTTSNTRVAGSTVVGATTSTTEHGLGSTTTTGPVVTSTTVLTPTGTKLPFTGGQSGPLLVLGILFLATGAALTLSATRGRRGSRA